MSSLPPLLAQWVPSLAREPLAVPVRAGWSRFNPSIVHLDDLTTIAVRSANYRLLDGGRYEYDGGVIRSETVLVDLVDGDLVNPRSARIETDRTPSHFPVSGWEDLRLFAHDGAVHALSTVRDVDDTGLCRIALLVPSGTGGFTEVLVEGPSAGRHEKNWAPWPTRGAVRAVYSWDPVRLIEIDISTGRTTITRVGSSGLGPHTRGGSGGIELASGDTLFIVHESHSTSRGRVYLHRFVTLDAEGAVTTASPRIRFSSLGVEFVAGATLHGETLLMTFGIDDREAWLARVPLEGILDRMSPVRRAAEARA